VARRIRIQYAGALYHVLNRGDRDGPIFIDDSDRESFLKTLDVTRAKTSWRIHAYVLMPEHFHLVVRTPEPNLVAGMKWLLGTYTRRFNVRHGLRGHLFAGRYKAIPIGPQGGYLPAAVDYVHLNPARAGLIAAHESLREFRWSSFGNYLAAHGAPGDGVKVEPVESAALKPIRGIALDFEQHTEWRRTQELTEEFQGLRHGWYFGDESFRAELLGRLNSADTAHHSGPEIHESAEAKAERIVARELARLEWSEQELREQAKGDLEKIRIAELLRLESTMTINWIANRLRMGTPGHLSHLLYWRRRGTRPAKPQTAHASRKPVRSTRSESKGLPARATLEPSRPMNAQEAGSNDWQPFTFDPTFD